MAARHARSRFILLEHPAFWLALLAGMEIGGAQAGPGRHPHPPVPPAVVRDVALGGDEDSDAPARPMRALPTNSVRHGARGLDAGTRGRSAGGVTPAVASPTLAPLGAARAIVDEDELPGSERAWTPSGIRGPPA
jgi:hypothetical protein